MERPHEAAGCGARRRTRAGGTLREGTVGNQPLSAYVQNGGLAYLVMTGALPQAVGRTDARRDPRQHHTLLAHEHGGLCVSLYWEYKGGFFNAKGVSIPVAVTVFPGEQYQAPRSWTERAYPKLIYYNKVDKGGHFAAWEQPQLFAAEVRAAFRSLR